MVRWIAALVGLAFAGVLAIALVITVSGVVSDSTPKIWTGAPESAETEFHKHPRGAG